MSTQDEFEAWFDGWRLETWRRAPSTRGKPMPAHWNTNARYHMHTAWQAANALLAATPAVPAEPTDERQAAEGKYACSAFNYERDPIGSRDWTLYWKGWQARAAIAASPGALTDAEPTPETLNRMAYLLRIVPDGEIVPADILLALKKQYLAAMLAAASASPAALTDRQIAAQDARYAIDGAITYGRMGTNKPPVGHWLAEYWSIGRQLAKLGETSAWDNQTPISASPADQVEDAPARIDAMFKNRLTPYGMLVRALRIVAATSLYDMAKYMNMSSAELSSLEFGRKEVTQDHINAAARFFMRYGIETMQPLIAALQTNREWSDAAMSASKEGH